MLGRSLLLQLKTLLTIAILPWSWRKITVSLLFKYLKPKQRKMTNVMAAVNWRSWRRSRMHPWFRSKRDTQSLAEPLVYQTEALQKTPTPSATPILGQNALCQLQKQAIPPLKITFSHRRQHFGGSHWLTLKFSMRNTF